MLSLRFNSDTVRSKLSVTIPAVSSSSGFNSDTVRSKRGLVPQILICPRVSIPTRCDQNDHWNSARWRHSVVSIPTRCDQNVGNTAVFFCSTSFQFRHGAIKTGGIMLTLAFPSAFQFRHGAIKTGTSGVTLKPRTSFQFRHGAIKTPGYDRSLHLLCCVSIPTRCDQNWEKREVPMSLLGFNSDTVRSKPVRTGPGSMPASTSFQFRHGAIKTGPLGEYDFHIASFNSDTVRSKRMGFSIPSAPGNVSIPTRCDQNRSR